jgi:glutathione S-transferase
MDLFMSPFACSLASHIALREAGLQVDLHPVVLATKLTRDGFDFRAVSPKGQVPVLRLDDGRVLTEGPAILQYLADQRPDSGLLPPVGSLDRYEVLAWVNFVGTEIHKHVFWPTFSPTAPAAVKAFAREQLGPKLDHLAAWLADREFLVGQQFTIADAYLTWALNICTMAGFGLDGWPVLGAYLTRMQQRPKVAEAIAAEAAMTK